MKVLQAGNKIKVVSGTYKGEFGTIREVEYLPVIDNGVAIPAYFIDFPNTKFKSLNTMLFFRSEVEIINDEPIPCVCGEVS